jgi:alpha-D-xyloside xylohydrolase
MHEQVTFQNDPVDPSAEFAKQQNHFFVADAVAELDPSAARGELSWRRRALSQRVSYHQVTLQLEDTQLWRDMPEEEYRDEQAFPFAMTFPSPRAIRVQIAARPGLEERDSPMLEKCEPGPPWEHEDAGERCTWRGPHGALALRRDPWALQLHDAAGRLLTRTNHHTESPSVVNTKPIPFSHVRSSASFHRHLAASFLLSPGERLYGCGESFTRLDKRGQKLCLWTRDAYSVQTPAMYKPVPFFLSSRGYGVFVHTGAPITFDLGHDYDSAAVLYLGEDVLDLFLFLGEPADVLSEPPRSPAAARCRRSGRSGSGWDATPTSRPTRFATLRGGCGANGFRATSSTSTRAGPSASSAPTSSSPPRASPIPAGSAGICASRGSG